ncbi:MAG: hypothetical protein COB53_12775 [Elusimicrobia bacterium]|nr:MAG: hypothetical protein COB53_12775 [Elusimicrobiota bacterium]
MPDPLDIDNLTAMQLGKVLGLESFYPDLNSGKLKSLFPNSGLYFFQRREAVIRQGTASRNLYILLTGKLRVSQKRSKETVELAELDAVTMVGEIALLKPDAIRTANVDTITTAQIFLLVRDDVQRVMEATPDLGKHLVGLARERLAKAHV